MSFGALDFFQYYNIEYITEGHKHVRQGWIGIKCPFCMGNPGYHLGFNIKHGFFTCWRCGAHRAYDVVFALLDGNKREIQAAMLRFKGRPVGRHKRSREKIDDRVLELPMGLQSLTSRARKYLQGRKFNPDMLELVWRIQSTDVVGDLKHRIFIPIYYNNLLCSWQCRDITGKSKIKYISQSEDKEILNNKSVLYGLDQAAGRVCVVVEGVTDTWRLGPGAVATFGVKYTQAQVNLLLENFEEFYILFDSAKDDPQAGEQAGKLAWDLSCFGDKKVRICALDDADPGDMPQKEADDFMRSIGAGGY